MDFELTPGQQRLAEQTRDYAERVIRPSAGRFDQVERAADFPFDLMQPCGHRDRAGRSADH